MSPQPDTHSLTHSHGQNTREQGLSPTDESPLNRDVTSSLDDQAADWVARLHADDVSEADTHQFNQWLQCSVAHQAAYEDALILWQELEHTCGDYYADPEVLLADINAAKQSPLDDIDDVGCSVQRRGIHWRSPLSYAMVSLMLLTVWIASPWIYLSAADYQTGLAETRTLHLDDGSRVVMNANTALNVDLTGTRREVELLSGEAYFDVAPDPTRPYRVITEDGITQVLGTEFNVALADRSTRVDVFEGRVQVTAAGGEQAHLTAHQYQRFAQTFIADNRSSDAAQTRILGWQQGLLLVQNQPLRAVLKQLNRNYPGYFVVMDDDLLDTNINAALSLTDRAAALRLLTQSLDLQYRSLSGVTLMYR